MHSTLPDRRDTGNWLDRFCEWAVSKALQVAAERPFCGFPTGSNIWPLTELEANENTRIDGETVDELLRSGLLEARPIDVIVKGEQSPNADIAPDLEFEHEIVITTSGRRALAEQEGRDDE